MQLQNVNKGIMKKDMKAIKKKTMKMGQYFIFWDNLLWRHHLGKTLEKLLKIIMFTKEVIWLVP